MRHHRKILLNRGDPGGTPEEIYGKVVEKIPSPAVGIPKAMRKYFLELFVKIFFFEFDLLAKIGPFHSLFRQCFFFIP